MPKLTKGRRAPQAATVKKTAKQRPPAGVDDSTPEIRASQDRTAQTVQWLLSQADICHCARCLAIDHRAHARGLVDLLIASMEHLGQRNTSKYLDALRLRSRCGDRLPAYQTHNGFAVAPEAPSPVPSDFCRRLAAENAVKTRAAALAVANQGSIS